MREGLSALGLALVVALFCFPLYVGLGKADLKNDEAIYSYAVDSILEQGDWMAPKSSPNPTITFLEKPPLKFWIVAAPIALGLLPHNEFGLRFWDATFGALAFVYVFAIGRRLAGPVCGVVAVMLLFVQGPLLMEHGLRENAMEAPLVLSYCGGIYHVMRWASAATPRTAQLHLVVAALFFVLGFLTKFVASLFFPLVVALVTLSSPVWRGHLTARWRQLLVAAGVVLASVVPWFVYAHLRFGQLLWDVMFREHVYHRFTAHMDPRHLQPWSYYFDQIITELHYSKILTLTSVSLGLFLVDTIRRRWPEGLLVLCWFFVPVTLISLGTSKLLHYAYPFLPPLAIIGAYLPAVLWRVFTSGLTAAPGWLQRRGGGRAAGLLELVRRPPIRQVLLALAAASALVALYTAFVGPIRLRAGGATLFRNTSVLRPALVGLVAFILVGAPRRAIALAIAPILMLLLPVDIYRQRRVELLKGEAPLRLSRNCLERLQTSGEAPARGVLVDLPEEYFQHQYYYYLRGLGPWERRYDHLPARIYSAVLDPAHQRPLLVSGDWYGDTIRRLRAGDAATVAAVAQATGHDAADVRARADKRNEPLVGFAEVLFFFPGPYGPCAAEARPR